MRRLTIIATLAAVSGCTFFSSSNVCGFGGTCNTYVDGGRDAGEGDGGAPPADAGLVAGDAGGDAGVADAGQDAGMDAGLGDAGPVCPADAGPIPAPLQIGPAAASCLSDTTPSQIIYVDADAGNDANDGGFGFALQTIGGAISLAADAGFTTPAEIRVCAGSYEESVVLGIPISLKGGYDCRSGARSTQCFNPALADSGVPYFGPGSSAATTTITSPSTATTVTLDGTLTAIPSTVQFDGFTVKGPSNSNGASEALAVQGNVQAEISNNAIIGGTGTGDGMYGHVACLGLLLNASESWPEVHHNFINGGRGSAYGSGSLASAGIAIPGGAAYIHDNRIEGGNSTVVSGFAGTSVAAAIFNLNASKLTMGTENPIAYNSIYGGQGFSGSSSSLQITGGIVMPADPSSDIDFVGNIIEGGDVVAGSLSGKHGAIAISSQVGGEACPEQSCSQYPTVQIIGNKIYGGDSAAGASSTALFLSGNPTTYNVVNNMIHAGGARQANTSTRTAIDFAQAQLAVVAGNTLYAGGNANNEGIALTIEPASSAVYAHAISIDGNILAGNNLQTLGIQFQANACPDADHAILQELQDNLFLNQSVGAAFYAPGAGCWSGNAYPVEQLYASLLGANPGGNYAGNLVFRSSCPNPVNGCFVRPDICDGSADGGLGCLQDVFVSWDASSQGLSDLYDAGWNLNPTPVTAPNLPLCSVTAQAALGGQGTPWNEDIYGVSRTAANNSLGAAVLNACCL